MSKAVSLIDHDQKWNAQVLIKSRIVHLVGKSRLDYEMFAQSAQGGCIGYMRGIEGNPVVGFERMILKEVSISSQKIMSG